MAKNNACTRMEALSFIRADLAMTFPVVSLHRICIGEEQAEYLLANYEMDGVKKAVSVGALIWVSGIVGLRMTTRLPAG